MALYMTIVMGGTPIGSPIIGWIGQHLGARWTLVVGGVLLIAVGAGARGLRAAAPRATPGRRSRRRVLALLSGSAF